MLNQELIEQGYGYADVRFRHVHRERFEQLEKEARSEKRGLWAGVKPEQYPPWRQEREAKVKEKVKR